MSSPFPGMNPYFEEEEVWHDFHKRALPTIAEMLLPQLRPNYNVKVNRHSDAHGRPAALDVERQSYVEIRDRVNRQVVTVIELLSPTNKRPGGDRDLYLAKRDEFLRSPAHLIEIDLLRGGPRLPVEGLPECDYCTLVSRADDRPRVGIWPFQLKDPLSAIPIPLRRDDVEAKLDLQELVHRIHDSAGYSDYIYEGNPQPPLNAETAEWASSFLPAIR